MILLLGARRILQTRDENLKVHKQNGGSPTCCWFYKGVRSSRDFRGRHEIKCMYMYLDKTIRN